MELASTSKIGIDETRLKRDEIKDVDEMFLTGTPEEIVPIVRVDDQVIGSGKPGPVTKKLQKEFTDSVRKWLGG